VPVYTQIPRVQAFQEFGKAGLVLVSFCPVQILRPLWAMEPKMATMGKLDATSMAAIGEQLRLMYAEIIAEGVPERFAENPAEAGQ
jgi:hypothetical protein